jgi:hypothetical protein
MIAWTRLVGITAWIMSASLGCAGATPEPSAPSYFRSPPLDYSDPPRSANDGEVLGAQEQAPDDWLRGNATTLHAAPGWSYDYGQLRFHRERARAGIGVPLEPLACVPPRSALLTPDEAAANAALHRAWQAARQPSLPLFASAVTEPVSAEQPHVLSCDRP